jgi:hypothetical protein
VQRSSPLVQWQGVTLNPSPIDVDQFHEKDIRRAMPRFQPENFAKNMVFLRPYKK